MASCYRDRAPVYERVYHKPERQAELRAIEAWLGSAQGPFAGRSVLEIACGTGWWTPHGARHCAHCLASDVNPETLAIARTKPLPPGRVKFAVVDAYTLQGLPERWRFDAAFAGFWWSHVPRRQLAGWLALLAGRLDRGARVVFVDNRYVEGSSTPLAYRSAAGDTYQRRTLDDGSVHEVLKNFPSREEVVAALGALAAGVQWTEHAHYWIADAVLR